MDNVKKQYRLDKAYMDTAKALSQLSYAERAKVGCVIVNNNGQIVSQGYNGTPNGFDNKCEENGATKKEVLHAESNAIAKCAKWGGSTAGSTLYVTLSPCYECAKMIIQAGISRVVYCDTYRDTEGLQLLRRAKVSLCKIHNIQKDEDDAMCKQ